MQLFRRGKEVAIYVAGEADGRLDAQDYMEFYGERNDGVLDQELYKNPAHQVHQLHSMYTDSAAYFLTINPAGGNKRMRELNPSPNGMTPEPYHLQKATLLQTGTIQLGKPYGANRMPWMDRGEGYFSSVSESTLNFNITGITNVVPTGPKPLLKYAIVGPDDKTHRIDINVVNGSPYKINTADYGAYDFYKSQHELEFAHITTSQNRVTLQLVSQDVNGSKGKAGLAYAQVTFPQKSIYAGKSMFLYTDSLRSATPYFEFTSAPASVIAYNVTDQQNIVRTAGYVNGTAKGFVLNAGPNQQKVLLARTDQALIPVGTPKAVNFREIKPEAFNFIIVTNKLLMQPAEGSSIPAPKEYAAYRKSAAGGAYDTLLVFVDDLADQFHYGEFSPNALRRLSTYMLQSPRQKFMLYLGKSLELRRLNYKSAASRSQDLVPSGLGTHPGSDILFSADFRNNNYEPRIATGRITARTPDDIIAYLNKLKEYEGVEDGAEWRKNILQLGGGLKVEEIDQINGFLNYYASIAKGPLLGANVIQKTRKNLSEVVETMDVSKEINNGVSLITFFGHSSSGTVDLDIGVPSSPLSNYKNKGKYPVMIMNGCNLGEIFYTNTSSFGEDWILTPDKGAIAFIAHINTGYVSDLNRYSSNFYSVAFQDPDFYGKTLGEVQRETVRRVQQLSRSGISTAMMLEMILQGDPAVRIYNPDKPDYLVKENSFELKGQRGVMASAVSDSLVLSFDVQNLGKAISDSLYLSVKRTLPDNTVMDTDSFKVAPVYNSSRVQLTLPNKGIASKGINTFEVTVDSRHAIDELKEDNNTAVYQRYISASGLTLVKPMKYSIVEATTVSLAVQSVVANENKGVYFEIDTTHAFNSPWLKKNSNTKSGFASWDVNLINSASDSIVYYWRARFGTYETGEDTVWVQSSFRHIPEVPAGWSQSHRGQFTEATLDGMKPLDQERGVWEFGKIRKFIDIKTAGGDIHFNDPPYGLFIDGRQQLNYWCGNPTYYKYTQPRFYIIVFNNVTLEPVTDLPGQVMCTTYPYIFDTDDLRKQVNIDKLNSFINSIPAGYHVAVIGMQNIPFNDFTDETKAAFKSIGSKLIDELRTGDPFVLLGQKGAAPGTAQEKTYSKEEAEREGGTPASSQSIELNVTLESNRQTGTITSTAIGPALKWGSLHHDIKAYAGGNDKYTLRLIGVNAAGEETVLENKVTSRVLDISHIDATLYPNLKLSAFLSDSTARTAPQLKEWFVLYDPVPEGVIRPDLVKASSDDLSQLAGSGNLTVPMAFQNVTSTAFTDSLTVEVVFSGAGISSTTSRFKIKPLGANETVYFNHAVSTAELDGDYSISFYVNPRLVLEQEYANNIYEVDFKVKSKLHPIMDVAFDGIHILDGDIVSPSPLISVTVKDENRHVFLQDPSRMSMVLISPEGQEKEVELMANQEVVYTPATEANDFKLEYKPGKLEDGKYTLQVRAKDAAGKESGVSPYRIGFEVVSESSISNFYPFPNPFSTKTNFIFTITGSTIPEHMKIQILTITGKVVKEIMKEELGPLRIGNNKTEYAWDGTDMYGDKLANGVYLYRVVMSKAEEDMKHRNTFGDGTFKNGYGKLYILR
ncbi:C25 family cysteine peptidase [Pontibacter anaerobius]|uniref:C25 family cysteine peptidase n=1 Tax=Pontibacter anaerobius TaxID=2993940 RepID=A0ABT3RE81_9BACT|nr:C25 family cysteine peptidase [Pontibacter anaerobius]MCX2740147.1 C25 family cysteine peptidase [Pontibacter anaerobius]